MKEFKHEFLILKLYDIEKLTNARSHPACTTRAIARHSTIPIYIIGYFSIKLFRLRIFLNYNHEHIYQDINHSDSCCLYNLRSLCRFHRHYLLLIRYLRKFSYKWNSSKYNEPKHIPTHVWLWLLQFPFVQSAATKHLPFT